MMFSKENLSAITSGYINQKKASQQQVDATNYYNQQKKASQQQVDATNYYNQQMNQGTPSMGQGTPFQLGQGTSVNSDNVFTDPQFAINSAVAVISENDKPALVKLLQRQGSFVTPLSSKKTLIDATFKAIQDSPKFREELQSYIVGEVTGTPIFKPQSQNDGSLIKIAQNSFPTLGKGNRKLKAESLNSDFSSFTDFDDNFANETGKTQTRAGEILSTIFSQENINTALGLGMGVIATRMNEKSKKGSNQQAIDFEKAQTEKALAQAKILEAQGKLPQVPITPVTPEGSKKWIMPVAIGGGVLLLGVIIYFAMKKKK